MPGRATFDIVPGCIELQTLQSDHRQSQPAAAALGMRRQQDLVDQHRGIIML
jgi:hypothetical protein